MSTDVLPNNSLILTSKGERLKAEKKSALELQMRKHPDWDDNYLLYRNKVKTNRLTQRQAVNIPLMKETVKTLLARIDDPVEVDFKELSGDEEKQLYYNQVWADRVKRNKFDLIAILDKKNVLLYGLSTRMLNIDENGVSGSVLDPYDIVFDPLMNPWDLNSARFIIRLNIFKSVREILADDRYTKEGRDELKIWSVSTPGITQSQENQKAFNEKMERAKSMGVKEADFKLFAGGDRIVNLTEHFTTVWDEKKEKWERRVVTYAQDEIELIDQSLEDALGVDFWPFVVWSEDPETNDIYPDAVADLVRVPNKVLNVWFSQMIENRTLKNFQMHWYSPIQGYTPQTYVPGPGVMLPAPPGDDINKVLKPVEISGLDDTFAAINAVTSFVERGTGATAIEKGTPEKGEQTLGEIKILVGKAQERTNGMTKFYKLAEYEFAWKWDKMMQANAPKFIKLFKLGRNGVAFPKTVYKSDWVSKAGYEPMVRSSSEEELEQTKSIQKFMFILQQFPNNIPLKKIAQKRMLEVVDLSPDELRQVEEGEKATQTAPQPNAPAPVDPNLLKEVQGRMSALQI